MHGIRISSLQIIKHPDPRLRKRSAPVEKFGDELTRLAHRMFQLMHENKGVGLAAPQVGLNLRLFVFNVTGEPGDDTAVVNPRLTDLEGESAAEEGCLSIPDVTVTMSRAERCTLTGHDLEGKPIRLNGVDLAARCWQHECDHLDGKLIIDHMSEADKIANRKAIRKLEEADRKR
ncbi:MAG: peptide deformylase [Phycisphaerae bacterium]|nr:peptide deformylase [Phycisphaerae bacterium]